MIGKWSYLRKIRSHSGKLGRLNKYHIISLTCGIKENGRDEPICKVEIVTDV